MTLRWLPRSLLAVLNVLSASFARRRRFIFEIELELAGQPLERLAVFFGGLAGYLSRKFGGGCLFIPMYAFQVIAYVLLVEAGRVGAGGILIGGPETG